MTETDTGVETLSPRLDGSLNDLAVRLIPTAAVLAVAGALAWVELGKIAARDWLPYAVVTALVLATVLLAGAAFGARRTALLAPGAVVAFAAWAAVTIAWSDVPWLSRDEALLTLFYATALLVPLATLRTELERVAGVALLVLALGVLALMTAFKLRFGSSPLAAFDDGRLDFPVTYVNGDAAFFLVGFWPAIALAARRALPTAVRAPALAAAVAFLAAGLMAQSKGGALGLAASAVAFFTVCPQRLRSLVPTFVATAIVAGAYSPLTAPYRLDGDAAVTHAIRHAGAILVVLTLLGAAAGIAYTIADAHLSVSPRMHRLLGIVALAAVATALVGSAIGFALAVDSPRSWAADKWHAFKHMSNDRSSTHLLALGSNRYDIWRVSLDEFRRHPVTGIGARGFLPAYLRERRSPEMPARAHSLPLEVLAEDGLIGFTLLGVAVGLPLVLAARAAATAPAAGALGGGVYWLAHASVDWIWTIPACGVVFFVLLGLGIPRPMPRRLRGPTRYVAAAAAALAALLLFAPPWLSARLTTDAVARGDRSELRWARRLDPLSVDPLYGEYRLSASPQAKIAIARRAVDVAPDWIGTRYLLGLAYLDAGEKRAARRELKRAQRLDPKNDEIKRRLAQTR